MRHRAFVIAACCWSVLGFGCGDDDDGTPVDGTCEDNGGQHCFELPTAALTVTPDGMPTTAPNLDCGPDVAGTLDAELAISGTIKDYLSGDLIAGATAEVYFDNAIEGTADLTGTADDQGVYSYTVPAGTSTLVAGVTDAPGDFLQLRGYRMRFNPEGDNSDVALWVLGRESANSIYGLVGIPPDETLGTVTIAPSDCDGEALQHAVGTISTTSSADGGAPTFVDGAYVFYGASGDLPAPVRRNVRTDTADNGVVFVFGVEPGTYYAQAWGFVAADDVELGSDGLQLIAEYPIEVAADAVSGTFARPSQGPF